MRKIGSIVLSLSIVCPSYPRIVVSIGVTSGADDLPPPVSIQRVSHDRIEFGGRWVFHLISPSSWWTTTRSLPFGVPNDNQLFQTLIASAHCVSEIGKYALLAYGRQTGFYSELTQDRHIGAFYGPRYSK